MIKSNCRPHIFRHRWCEHTFVEKTIGIIDSPCRETDIKFTGSPRKPILPLSGFQ